MLPGFLARVLGRRNVAGGQGRVAQRRVGVARGNPANLGGGLDGRVGRGPGRTRVTLPRQHGALARETLRLIKHIVSGFGLGNKFGELCGGADQITLPPLCYAKAPAALARAEPVTDRIGEIASLFGSRAPRDQITHRERRERLPGEDLAQPPPIVQLPGKADRLGKVRPGRLGVRGWR